MIEPYEAAVGKADELADLRVEKAEAAARLVVMARQIQDQEERLQGLENEKSALDKDSQSHDDEWKRMWSGLPSDPLAPDVMLEWLGIRKEWLGALERKSEIERKLAALLRQEEETRQSVLSGLSGNGSAGIDLSALSGLPLSVLLKRVDAILSENDRIQEQKQKLEAEILQAKTQISRKKSSLEKAEKARADWEEQWSAAVTDLGLDPRSSPEIVTGQVDSIEDMRTVAVQINELRHRRIGPIHRDCEAFAQEVQRTLPILAPDLTALDAEEAVLRLEKRLEEAKRLNESKKEKEASIRALTKEIGTFETSLKEARGTISRLKSLAGVEEISELKVAISKSDRSSSLQEEKKRLLRVLTEEGDGLPVPDLLAECEGVDLDQISAREESVSQDLEALRKQLLEARDRRTETRSAFESVGGDDTAAKAEAKRQEALAEMKEIAARYTHVRTSAILLKWAIDRYRREKQAPLLKTAGSLFALLTGNSFLSLRIDFDDQDRPQLVGVRSDRSSTVHVSGLSTGTADQLYLALRVASVLEYLDRAPALPFIADDLFINFDDERASAGFKVLSQLAEKTQVIFFTHHQHLVEIGKKSLGSSLSVISL
ncbi:MAG: hypothetical protein VST70_00190 [Nitrospirota bacterium]|nr:hypothetical protein [Nitrospirota bacterium]